MNHPTSHTIGVQIIAPAIPHYRLPLYRGLLERPDLSVRITSSQVDISGLASAPEATQVADLEHPWVHLARDRLFWQMHLSLEPRLKRGDVLVVTGNPRFLSNYPMMVAARRRGVAIVWWGHGWTAGAWRITAAIRRQIMKLADIVLLYTDAEIEEFVRFGFPRGRLFATNNGLDLAPIDHQRALWSDDAIRAFKEKFNLSGRRVLLFCGRLTEKAKLRLAFDSLAHIKGIPGSLVPLLIVIGDGSQRQPLAEYSNKLGLSGDIRWLGPVYEESELAPWFLCADYFVYPGAIGLGAIHSLAYGTPVITHNSRPHHMPEFAALSDTSNAILFAHDDPTDLTNKLKMVYDQPELRKRMSIAALNSVRHTFNLNDSLRRFASAIESASRHAMT